MFILERERSSQFSTPGRLYWREGAAQTALAYTLEDVVREKFTQSGSLVDPPSWKVPGKTAIPSGEYAVITDYSMRFQRVMPHILGVPGFEGVRIHGGNTSADTEGCVLVGLNRDSDNRITLCASAMTKVFNLLNANPMSGSVTITIKPYADDIRALALGVKL